jgi:DNA invertase Pin-like site-specific DNA recombinase
MAENLEQKAVEVKETAEKPNESDWLKQHEEREAEREAIRSLAHARKARTYEGIVYKHANPTPNPMDDTEKDVSVYTRVSTTSLNQTSSIENQELFYREKIAKTPNWNLTEVYSDEGKSGTSTRHRKDFQRMMADARAGKFDMIVCASVSRFARNVSDCIDYVTELRTMHPHKPIGVYFETENIFTLNKDADQTLGFHALLADWESGNKSRRMILSYDQRIFTNQFPVSDLLGYRHTKEGDLVIQPEEAQTVRYIYLAYLAGHSSAEIAEVLTEKQRPTLKGRTDWNSQMVRDIIENERRWGDLEVRKMVVLDYKKKKIVKNDGIREGAFVPNHHEGIVTPEVAKAALLMAQTSGRLDGVPELSVIDEGTLKGFVSINPMLPGITYDFFIASCESVYSEDELEEIHHEASILFGEEHSKIISMSCAGYQVPYGVYFLNNTMPSMTLSTKRITFSKPFHKKMNQCSAVEILYHPILKSIAVRPCEPDSLNAIPLVNENGEVKLSFPAKGFCTAIYDEMEWVEDFRFRFRGITKVRDGVPIMFFSLDEPRILVGKKKALVESMIEQDEESVKHFISCNRNDYPKDDTCDVAYPEEWQLSKHGLNYLQRQRRDRIIENVSKKDISIKGRKMVNPLIGVIPSRDEIESELSDLLMSM